MPINPLRKTREFMFKHQDQVDKQDLERLAYLQGPYFDKCIGIGMLGSVLAGLGIYRFVSKHTGLLRYGLYIGVIFPFGGGVYQHYKASISYLEFCAIKYEERGLKDFEYKLDNSP